MNNVYDGILRGSSVDFGEVRDGRRSALFHYDVDLSVARSVALGNPVILPVAGNAFYVDKNPLLIGSATVHFQDTTFGSAPSPVYCEPGFIAKVPFTQLLIENAAQPGMIFRFHYGVDIDFQPGASSSVNVNGSVKIIDDSKSFSLSAQSYMIHTYAAAAALVYSGVQLWNPPGSGKNIIVSQIGCVIGGGNSLQIGYLSAMLDGFVVTPQQPQNKKSGGGAGASGVGYYTINSVAPPIPTAGYGATNGMILRPVNPFIITPGYGLTFASPTVNNVCGAEIEFSEEPI